MISYRDEPLYFELPYNEEGKPLPFHLESFASSSHQNMEQIILNNRCHNDLFLSGGTRHRQIMRQERLGTGENKSWKYTAKG